MVYQWYMKMVGPLHYMVEKLYEQIIILRYLGVSVYRLLFIV